MAGRQRNDDDLAAARANLIGSDNRVGRIVAALDDHVWLQQLDELERRVLVEQRNGVDGLQCREDVYALSLAVHRATGAFETLDRCVAIHADHEHVSARARADEHVHMPRMEEIKHAIREYDAPLLTLAPNGERWPRHHFSARVESTQ